jgi:hypothetical protein
MVSLEKVASKVSERVHHADVSFDERRLGCDTPATAVAAGRSAVNGQPPRRARTQPGTWPDCQHACASPQRQQGQAPPMPRRRDARRIGRLNVATGRSQLTAQFPAPTHGILITYFIVSRDVGRSRRFSTEVLGGEAVLEGGPSIVALANGWVTISAAGEPTDDKPTATLRSRSCLKLPEHPRRRHQRRLRAMEQPRGRLPHPANRPRQRDPLLHERPRWPPDRGRPTGRAHRRLITPRLMFKINWPRKPWAWLETDPRARSNHDRPVSWLPAP